VSALRIPERFCGRPKEISGASEEDEIGGGFLRRGEEKESRNNFLLFPLLKPPLEVLETFGGAKVSDDRPAQNGARNPKVQRFSRLPLLK
jgi:hypothetical protein